MAQVKGIIVNDGGAPARIMNFIANEAISAGEALVFHTNGKAKLATDNNAGVCGFALTDAAAAAQVSMVTGRGVMLYVICHADVDAGDMLMVDETTPVAGSLIQTLEDGSGNLTNITVAIAQEDAPAAGGLTKVMVI